VELALKRVRESVATFDFGKQAFGDEETLLFEGG
jgi:hypothetical protein